MNSKTARLGLELIEPGQAQKEIFHNEALAAIDVGLQASVVAAGLDAPPVAPAPGQCWIVGASPIDGWAGHPQAIAGWTAGGWRFVAARDGLSAWDEARGIVQRFVGGNWEAGVIRGGELRIAGDRVVGPREPAIASPSGGATADAEARVALGAVLDALRRHGLIAS